MAQLRQDYGQFTACGAEILAVNPEGVAETKKFAQELALPFPMLVDPGHEVANRYGQQVNLFKLGRMPALFVLDREGVVRYEQHAKSMMDTAGNAEVLAVLDRLGNTGALAAMSPPAEAGV